MLKKILAGLAVGFAVGSSGAHALTVSYTENFDDGLSGWATGSNPGTVFTSGGVDDGAYLSTFANVTPVGFGTVQVLFRCESSACSDGAFQGDWRGTVGTLSWYFRHNADIALQAYARIAAPSNNPGASGVVTTLVQPNTWTRVDLGIVADNPELISFSGQSFDAVFDEVGRVQLGISFPTGYNATNLTFDIDQVSLVAPVPLPAAAWLFAPAVAGLGVVRRRRA
ncbi:MAG: VPLPA-CTERM sorting domain-containing protein [Gammaproteobacteria bacterium]